MLVLERCKKFAGEEDEPLLNGQNGHHELAIFSIHKIYIPLKDERRKSPIVVPQNPKIVVGSLALKLLGKLHRLAIKIITTCVQHALERYDDHLVKTGRT